MEALDISYFVVAMQPLGGILVSIPLGLLKLEYPLWFVVLSSPLLAYVQVPVVDLAWSLLLRIPGWKRLLERRRSPTVERLMASGGAFWTTFLAAPLVGPWVIMAFMRYAHVPQRRIALPILLSMLAVTLVTSTLCLVLPTLFN